jgi:phage-related protein
MGKGLHELRVSLASKREARVLFVVQDEQLIALHAFVKKSAKTPTADLDLARQRQRELEKKT